MAVAGTLESIRAMDNDQQVQVIQAGLDALEGMPVSDDRSAREAFTHVMVTVSRINELSAKARAQAMIGGGVPGDEITENLRERLDRLVSALPGIVGRLAGATAFSISVGANVAVTVDFSSSVGSSAKDRLRMPAVAGVCAPRSLAGQAWACPLLLVPGAAVVSGVQGSPTGAVGCSGAPAVTMVERAPRSRPCACGAVSAGCQTD
jgi:hypothetical protein